MTDHYRRQYPSLPDAEHLSPRLVELHTEADTVWARRSEAVRERQQLGTTGAEETARETDRKTASAKIRSGAPGDQIAATPAFDALVKRRDELDAEIGASTTAMREIEEEINIEFQKLQTDDKVSGRDALKTADARYRKAITALTTARADYMHARHLHDFKAGAAGVPSYPGFTWPPQPPLVPINALSTTGEKDYNLAPVTAEHLISRTFAADLEGTDK